MSDVFISYGRSTAPQAQATAAALRALGFSVWLDEDLPGHRPYAEVIEEQLTSAKAVVTIWSAEAVKSHWVCSEANRGREGGKLVQFAIDKARLPMPFDQIQCLNLVGWTGQGEHPAWPKVVASIDALVRGHGAPRPHPPSPPRAAAGEGERRHLTVLACNLVNATAISATVDPEQWHDILVRFQRQAFGAVRQMDGHVAQSLGDGFIAYFGYPEAREDAAECAVRAGLAVLEALGPLNAAMIAEHGAPLQVRIGVHSGTVVVAPGEGEQIGMFGDTPRTAMAIETQAAPDTVVVSGAVHELVAGLFVVEDCGTQPRRGVNEPIRLFRVIRAGLASGRLRGFAPREATPFVGREDELHLLASRWRRLRGGEGQSVLLIGEPGIGKTRLIDEFRASIKAEPHLWIEASGSPLTANTPFHAVTRMLDQGLGWRGEDGPDERVGRLEEALAPAGLKLAEAVPLIAELLGLPLPSTYPPLMFPPDQKRRRLLSALTAWVFSATTAQPLVIVIEDLQWVDPSTMELVQTLIEQGATAPLLLLCTARVEYRPPWSSRGHHTQITLGRLSDGQTRELVSAMADRAGLATEVVERIMERTDGVPLFAEELSRLMVEGDARSEGRDIPVTLLDSLTARLDRLGRAKEVAQLGAVLGRDFSYELIAAVAPMPEDELQADLARLADAELVFTRGLPPEASYQFKHALIQDAAYDALLKSRRRELHAQVARAIAERFPALAEAQPETLARHWTEAGEALAATAAWKRAGETAYARGAYTESEEDYRRALATLATQPEAAERDARELELCSGLNRVLQFTKGYAAPETVEVAGRARALAEKSGSTNHLIREEGRIWQALITAGDYAGAAILADHIFELIRADGDNLERGMFFHLAQVQTCYYTGDLAKAEEHFALGSPLIDVVAGQAPGNNQISIGVASLAAWIAGRAATAWARMDRGRALAKESGNPYDLAIALHFQGNLHALERAPEPAREAASQLLALSEENGLSYLGDLARGTLGWAMALQGAVEEGVELMRRSCEARSVARVGLSFGLIRLAEGQALAGRTDEALETLDGAMTFNPQERVFQPAAVVDRGEMRLSRGEAGPAEADFREAIVLAHDMGAKAWELRAAVSLARLRESLGDAGAARQIVSPVFESFTEPPGPTDLAEVEALLGSPRPLP